MASSSCSSKNRGKNLRSSRPVLVMQEDKVVKKKSSKKTEEEVLDFHKILQQRQERQERERDLNGLPETDSVSSMQILTDSQMFESSQDASFLSPSKLKINPLVEVKIFYDDQVFRLFGEDEINFSWIDNESSSLDVPKMPHSKLVHYLCTEMKVQLASRSAYNTIISCRYLFLLMSVTSNSIVMETCKELLLEKIACNARPFSIPVVDLVLVLINYGSLKNKIWLPEYKIKFSHQINKSLVDCFESNTNCNHLFPFENLKMMLEVLRFNWKNYPAFAEGEKIAVFHLMLNLLTANGIVHDWSIIPIIKDVISNIFLSFTDEEWRERRFSKVEDLAEASWHDDLDHVGIVQRIKSIPTSSLRGIQVQQTAAHFAIQNFMDFETIHLLGKVTLNDVIELTTEVMSKNCTDYGLTYSVVMLISLCVDLDNNTQDQNTLKEVALLLTQWRHSILDIANDMDENRLAVKDLLTELSTMIRDAQSVDHVV